MSCEMISRYIMKYFDRQANDIEQAQIKQHIKACIKCNEEFKSFSEILSVLEEEPEIEPPRDFELQVMNRIQNLEKKSKQHTEKIIMALYGLTTTLLLFAIAGFLSGLEEISILKLLGDISGSDSTAGVLIYLYRLAAGFYNIASTLFSILFDLAVTIIRSYYYVFVLSFVLLLILQKWYINLIHQDSGRKIE